MTEGVLLWVMTVIKINSRTFNFLTSFSKSTNTTSNAFFVNVVFKLQINVTTRTVNLFVQLEIIINIIWLFDILIIDQKIVQKNSSNAE